MKKKMIFFSLITTFILLSSVACTSTNADNSKVLIDKTGFVEEDSAVDLQGHKLELGSIEFEVEPTENVIQIMESSILTNSKEIVVSIKNIEDNEEIPLFLYDADNLEDPIAFHTLNSNNKKTTFTNLTSAKAYRIGAGVGSINENVTLTVSE